jgi:hypothetical protein
MEERSPPTSASPPSQDARVLQTDDAEVASTKFPARPDSSSIKSQGENEMNAQNAETVSKNRVVIKDTLSVDRLSGGCYASGAMFQNTIEEAMHSRLWHEEERIRVINERLKTLTKEYNEFLDLQREAENRKRRIQTLFSLVGPIDANAPDKQSAEHRVAINLLGESSEDLREKLPLWKAMREYLMHVPEARIGEMEAFFQSIKFSEGNRQAMESVLKRHIKTFKTRKEKREKYISLK